MIEITAWPGKQIDLGRRGENRARCIVFDISEWRRIYGSGAVYLLHRRKGDEAPYQVAIEAKKDKVYWTVGSADVAVSGYGRAELQYLAGKTVVKSVTWATFTANALDESGGTPPEPQQSWVEQVLRAGADARESARKAEDALLHGPVIGENGNWSVWDAESEAYADTGTPATGPAAEAIRPDWVQNDESEPDYIKNRPLYSGESEVIAEEQTFPIVEGEEWLYPLEAGELAEGKIYLVNFDGEEYTCKAYGLYNSENDGVFEGIAIGNIDITNESNIGGIYENKGNGEPFAVEMYSNGFVDAYAKPGEHTVRIERLGGVEIVPAYQEAIRESLPVVKLIATFEDGTKQTYALYGEAVTE